MAAPKIRFNNRKNKEFFAELRSRIDAYFTENGISKNANGAMVTKTIILFAFTYGAYFLMLLGSLPGWGIILAYVAMGIGFAGLGFNVGHDALHGAYSSNRTVNSMLGLSFNLMGVSDYLWKIKHNVKHHTYTNIFEHDDDLSVSGVVRLSPCAPYKKIHRYQHVTAFAGYTLLSLAWVLFTDYPKLISYTKAGVKHPPREIFRLIATKVFYLFYMIALPIMVIDAPWYFVLIGFVALHMVLGEVLAIIFQLAHIVEATDHPVPDTDLTMENAWAIHQLCTTANFSTNSKAMTWFAGGLNFQVEHHLFPNICSIHYPEVSKIVKATAEEYGVPYHDKHSFIQALGSHYRLLKKLSRPNTEVQVGYSFN